MLLQLAFIIAPLATASVIVDRMRAEEAVVRHVFSKALDKGTEIGPRAPDDCGQIIEIISREKFVIDYLSSFRPIGLLRLEDDCIAVLRLRHTIELTERIANPTELQPVERTELIVRLVGLYRIETEFEQRMIKNPVRRHRIGQNRFGGLKQTIIQFLLPLLRSRTTSNKIEQSYRMLRSYLETLDPSFHNHAIKGALQQAYAEMFTLRDGLVDELDRDMRRLNQYLYELHQHRVLAPQ
jgi:hypothetical protein